MWRRTIREGQANFRCHLDGHIAVIFHVCSFKDDDDDTEGQVVM